MQHPDLPPIDFAALERDPLAAILDACGLKHRRVSERSATLSLAHGPGEEPTRFTVEAARWTLRLSAAVETLHELDPPTLLYVNQVNVAAPLGAVCGITPSDRTLVLRITLPRAPAHTPAPTVVMAALTSLHALSGLVRERRSIGREVVEEIFGSDLTFGGLLDLGGIVKSLGAPVTQQPDGSFVMRTGYTPPSMNVFARFHSDPIAGLSVDALDPEQRRFPLDGRLLGATAQLGALLGVGGFALWPVEEPNVCLPVFRYALPMPWLAVAAEEDASLLSPDLLPTILDNASMAWEDLLRAQAGQPLSR